MEKNGIKFGFGVVAAGQRKSSYDPELVALTTHGGFRITPQISKALGIGNGDYIMFINNHDAVATAYNAGQLEGFDSVEAAIAELGQWAIAKGVRAFSDKGIALKTTERMSKKEKEALVAADFDSAYEAAMNSGNAEFIDALNADGVTRDQQIEILAAAMDSPEVDKYLGSKCSNASDMMGTGVVLNFCDSNIWNILKDGLRKDDKKVTLRTFPIELDELGTVEVFNGYENVTVPYLPLSKEYVDTVVSPRGAGKDAE